ncbi:MAG: ABC transporter ATP-binding protein [Clostridia bacterium]|nr:ABC transporter ATP-binding protein [Clostridia bacterium]
MKNKRYERKKSNYNLIKIFAPYFKNYKLTFAVDLLCASLTTVCEIILPLIVRKITDTAVQAPENLTLKLILITGAAYLVLRIIDAIANYYMATTGHIMGAKIETDMRRDLFAHMQGLSYTYYDNTKIGQLMSRITSDLFDVTEFAHHCPEEFFIAAIKIISVFVILSTMNIYLTLIIFILIPIMVLCVSKYNAKMKDAFKSQRNELGEINARTEDSLLGIRVVKSFAKEDEEKRKFQQGNEKFLKTKIKSYKYMGAFHTITRVFDGIMYICVVVIGGIFLMKKYITPGDLTAYILMVTTLLASVKRIVEYMEQFQRGMTGIDRFNEVMEELCENENDDDAPEINITDGNICFDNVSFYYDGTKENVLTNINLDVKPGENVAIVGPSGAGKTTICNLIPRFYNVTNGRILIDSQDVSKVSLKSLRSQIGVVQQDVYMFSGSVYDNIAYGKTDATRQEVEEAAKKAGAHEFIMAMPDGYDTFIGERGVKLSGGQKQRISIARVFLKNPPVLILDEATSALDNESEYIVQQSLEELTRGRTTFTIAHRLTTIRNATKILVLTEKGIEEQGTHEELIDKKGLYYNLESMYNKL